DAPRTYDCGITSEFVSPSGKVIKRDAFWDGSDDFLIRFAPTELGVWQWKASGPGVKTQGEITCVPYSGELPMYRHGFLKVGPKGRYLCHADNAPFFWLGDTHWHFAIGEKWGESNDPRFRNQFAAIVDKRAEQKFNVYQCNFHCEAMRMPGQETPEFFVRSENGLIPDIALFQENLDKKMEYLASKGFAIAAGFSWFYSAFAPDAKEWYESVAKYLVARYGAYPMIWTLAGEVGGYGKETQETLVNFWRGIALKVEELDSYGHLQTAHYTNERPFPSYFQDESWFDFTLNQAGHGDYPIDARPYRAHRALHDSKPFIEGESMYEQVLTLEPNGRRRATPEMLRRVAYLAIQNGACGYTYAAQGMWHFQWDEPKPGAPSIGFGSFPPWHKAIDFPGADQMAAMRDFYESVDWSKLTPLSPQCFAKSTDPFSITFDDGDFAALFMPSVSADPDMDTVVAYFAETNRYPLGLKTLTKPSYTAQWINPATGERTLISDSIEPDNGTWFAPAKPWEQDAILLVKAK
ncbi:MAG: DUF4038 domain-containing protein, partial [Clostridiales bacterium]|nr:DUF4038 domain-containing protein [Clostridiales bacterium]